MFSSLHRIPIMPDTASLVLAGATLLGSLAGKTSTDPVRDAELLDNVDPVKRILQSIGVDKPCHVRLILTNGLSIRMTKIVEIGYGGFIFHVLYARNEAPPAECFLRFSAVASVDFTGLANFRQTSEIHIECKGSPQAVFT